MMMALCDEGRDSNGEPMLRIGLQRTPEAPSVARAAVAGFFEERHIEPDALATLRLLVSELVSNAVLHSDAPSSSDIQLCVHLLEESAVRVEVIDRGNGFTPQPTAGVPYGGGYGLYLVEKQAAHWGVDQTDGTRVWFEMPSQ
jgi:anti-sigma regulatory factor (Ser/Thr protein kinase)